MRRDSGGFRMLVGMTSVRGLITNPMLPDGVPDYKRPGQALLIEVCRDDEGTAAMRRPGDSEVFTLEDLPPYSHLRLTEPPTDDDGRWLVDEIVAEGLPIADSPLSGTAERSARGRQASA